MAVAAGVKPESEMVALWMAVGLLLMTSRRGVPSVRLQPKAERRDESEVVPTMEDFS